MTKEDFGIDLFEAVKVIGGLLAVQDQHNAAVHKDDKGRQGELAATLEALKASLVPLMQRLDRRDVAEILARYPMVASL